MNLLSKYEPDPTNLLMILHDYQNHNEQNQITRENLVEIADYLNISYSWVCGVATYYSMFSIKPRGRHIIRICNSPVCNMEGAEPVLERLQSLLGVGVGETTDDGLFTIEHTECLGRCASAPMMMVDEELLGGITADNLGTIIEEFRRR